MASFPQCESIYKQQNEFLNREKSLSSLLDKFDVQPCFEVPEREVTINLDNVTLSPDQYTIFVNQLENSSMRIVYFSLLYFIFERSPQNQGVAMYERLLAFIYSHDMAAGAERGRVTDEEAKTYLTKFLYSLFRSKRKRKVVVEEFSCLPQMDLLMRQLMRRLTGEEDLIIEINGEEITAGLKNHLGFQVEFLNNETFVFQNEFLIEIRYFNENCSFHIRHQNEENLDSLRRDFLLLKSAHFSHQKQENGVSLEQSSRFGGKVKFRVTKKSTAKSIGLVSEDFCDEFEEKEREQFVPFGGILNNSGVNIGLLGGQSRQNEEDFLKEFDQLINSQPFFKEEKSLQSLQFRGDEDMEKSQNLKNQSLNAFFKTIIENKSIQVEENEGSLIDIKEDQVEEESFFDEFDQLINTQKGVSNEAVFLDNQSLLFGKIEKIEEEMKEELRVVEESNKSEDKKSEVMEDEREESFLDQFDKLINTQKGVQDNQPLLFGKNDSKQEKKEQKRDQLKIVQEQHKSEDKKSSKRSQKKSEGRQTNGRYRKDSSQWDTKSIKSHFLTRDTYDSWIIAESKNRFNQIKRKYPCSNPFITNQSSPFGFKTLVESQSTKLIKSARMEVPQERKRMRNPESIRVPSFIANRAKVKKQIENNSSLNLMKSTHVPFKKPLMTPNVTFTYQKS